KDENNKERIYLAVSNDAVNWERYGATPVIDDIKDNPRVKISGDPQIVKIDDIYVMFYFVCEEGKGAYNTFACSYDLVEWTKWTGTPLVQSEHEWENIYAHKPWVLKDKEVVYHFYCAVNKKGERFIALATSKPLQK
ncbi:MAG TPA: glycosylase, partial [Clostridia bacterium]|nr:glycosylase [Clostridia bacterium]